MRDADLLFLLGIIILILNVVLLFIKYMHTIVTNDELIIIGMWRNQSVRFPIDSIQSAEKTDYSTFHLNNAVFNLHDGNTLRFYAGGREAVKVIINDGRELFIGTVRANELCNVLNPSTT
jgi:hypothetical protein